MYSLNKKYQKEAESDEGYLHMKEAANKYTKITKWAFGDAVIDHSLEKRGLIGRQDNSELCEPGKC